MQVEGEPKYGPFYFELNTGAKMPSVGLGTWKAPSGVVGDAVIAAVKGGYRLIDCGSVYDNEKEVGLALNQLLSDGIIKRNELWITSKLWCSDHAAEDVSKALTKTLEDLQLDYVDLYLIHWPFRTKPGTHGWAPESMAPLCLPETWTAMERLYASGQARAIGVSNFSTPGPADVCKGASSCQPGGVPSCLAATKAPQLMSIYGRPFIGSWVKGEILKDPTLLHIAEKLNKSPAQVALRWGLQSGHTVLPKSTNESRIKENIDLFDWCIPQDLFVKFNEIPQVRLLRGDFAVHETCSPYKSLQELWDGEI